MNKGIMPDSDDPVKTPIETEDAPKTVAELTDAEYHELSDAYLEYLVSELERVAEAQEGVDVEFSVRQPLLPVLNLTLRLAPLLTTSRPECSPSHSPT
jgi:hypothetical protein